MRASVTDAPTLAPAVQNAEYVIVATGRRPGEASPKEVDRDGMVNILAAIEALAAVLEALAEQRYDGAAFALEELLHTHADQPLVWCLWQGEADTAAVEWPPRPDEL